MKKNIYLVLAIVNGIALYAFFVPWSNVHGFDMALMLQEIMATTLSTAILLDAVVVSVVFVIWVIYEQSRARVSYFWVPIVTIPLVGIAFAFPFYLYLRERQLERASLTSGR